MGADTAIAWTDSTFNPWWGCTKVDPLCVNCYAEAFDKRVGGAHWGAGTERRTFGAAHWNEPLKWNREAFKAGTRRRVFCASMADVFDDEAPTGELDRLWDLIRVTPSLDWLLLTKRAHRIRESLPIDWGTNGYENVWLGVSVGEDGGRWRIGALAAVPAKVRFLSMEPLLQPMPNLHLDGIDWVIVGAESGHGRRPMALDWVRGIRDQCAGRAGFFFKQTVDAATGRKTETPELDGRRWVEAPASRRSAP